MNFPFTLNSAVAQPLAVPITTPVRGGGIEFDPLVLFFDAETGAWYDIHPDYCFQDLEGTPAAVGDPVGLVLDRSQGTNDLTSNLGPELVTNGTFDTDISGWVDDSVSGGTIQWNAAGYLELEYVSGVPVVNQIISTVAGKVYIVSWDVPQLTNRYDFDIQSVSPAASLIGGLKRVSSTDSVSYIIIAEGSETKLYFRSIDPGTFGLDNISVRELPGYHLTQTTAAARPVLGRVPLSGRRNLLTYTEDFSNAVWTKSEVTVTANAGAAPDGTMTADLVVPSATSTASHRIYQDVTMAAGLACGSVYFKAAGYNYARIAAGGGENVNVDLTDGSLISVNGTPDSFFITSVGDGWYRAGSTKAAIVGTNRLQIFVYETSDLAAYSGDGVSGVLVWGAQREKSAVSGYQRVTTDLDVTEAGVRDTYYLQSDETDDLLTVTLPAITGQIAIAASEGTAIYGVDISAGSWPFMRNTAAQVYTFMPETQGAVLVDDTMTDAEKASVLRYLANEGGGPTGADAFSGVTDFTNYWRDATWITEFPVIDTSSGTSFSAAWRDCSSLTSFPLLDTSSGTNFVEAWYNCSSLTSFPLIDTSSGTNFFRAWRNCSSLTSFPLLDTSSGTTFAETWRNCSSLTSFPLLDTSSGTNFSYAWRDCSSLTSFPLIDTSSGTNFLQAWYNCSSLTSFPLINTSSGTNFQQTWQLCSSLTSFPLIDTSSGTNFFRAWYGCSSLTSFPLINTSSGTNFNAAWYDCSSLTDFPAGFFDSWTGTPVNNCFYLTWDGCSSLTATSVENILVSIDTSGQSAPASGVDITIDYDVGTGSLTASTTTAITSLKGKGWTITINGVLQ